MKCVCRTVKQRHRCVRANRARYDLPDRCWAPPLKKKPFVSTKGHESWLSYDQRKKMQNCEFIDGDVY